MIITETKKDWYIAKTANLAFFGRNRSEVMARAYWHISQMKGAANGQ